MKVKASTYLVLEPQHNYRGEVDGLRIDRIVQNRPKLNSRNVAVLLTITIDGSVFQQFVPEVTVEIGGAASLFTPTVDVTPPADQEPEGPEDPEADPA